MKPMVQKLYMIEYDVLSRWQKAAPISHKRHLMNWVWEKGSCMGFSQQICSALAELWIKALIKPRRHFLSWSTTRCHHGREVNSATSAHEQTTWWNSAIDKSKEEKTGINEWINVATVKNTCFQVDFFVCVYTLEQNVISCFFHFVYLVLTGDLT